MLEWLGKLSKRRLFWTLVVSSFIFLDAVSYWITSRIPGSCIVSTIGDKTDYAQNYENYNCPSLHIFIAEMLASAFQRIAAVDTLFIVGAFAVFFIAWHIIAKLCDEPITPLGTLKRLDAIQILTLAIAIIGFFQFLSFERTDNTLRDTLATNRAVQRAFVVVNELRQDPITDQTGKISAIQFVPVIKNSGITPARTMSFVMMTPRNDSAFLMPNFERNRLIAYILQAPTDPDEILTKRPHDAEPLITDNIMLGPQAVLVPITAAETFTTQDLLGISTGTTRNGRFFYGSIRYVDIFDRQRISKYCFRIDGLNLSGEGVATPLPGLCNHWNCTDEDCKIDKDQYETALNTIPKCTADAPPDSFCRSPP